MNCSPFDLRDYWFEELAPNERSQVETHLAACTGCRQELERLRLVGQTMRQLKDEEVPRRIAFVSDKVFEPSGPARWLRNLWPGAPRLAWSAALLLAVFFGGAWLCEPTMTVENGRWQIALGGGQARLEKALAAVEARQAAEMRNAEQAFEMVMKQVNELYKAQARPAVFQQ